MNFKIKNRQDKEAVKSYLDKLPEGKQFDVSIKAPRIIRSLPQNRLYWLKVACIADETGADKEQIHDELKKMYLPRKSVRTMYRNFIEVPLSTTELSTKQFTDYLEKIDAFASSELSIALPNPGDLAWNAFYEFYKDKI